MSSAAGLTPVSAVERVVESGLVQNRRWRLRTYNDVFVGREAVTALVQSGACSDRSEAVSVLRTALESNLIAHALHQHHFEDKYLFYRTLAGGDDGDEAPEIDSRLNMAQLKVGAKKHGQATVRSGGFTAKGRYILLSSNNVLHEFSNAHSPIPLRSLPLDQCASGAVSFCGKLKSGKYGISVYPPLCEMSMNKGGGGGETKGLDFEDESRIVLLFDDIQDQESWLHSLVKGGLTFKELSFELTVPDKATSIHDFSVAKPNSLGPVDLRTVCEGKVAVIVNVASF